MDRRVDLSRRLSIRWESDVDPVTAGAIFSAGPLITVAPSGRESPVGIRTRKAAPTGHGGLHGRRREESGRPRTPATRRSDLNDCCDPDDRPRSRCLGRRDGLRRQIRALRDRGYTAIGFGNPLRDLAGDAAYLAEFLRTISGPILLVGHSTAAM